MKTWLFLMKLGHIWGCHQRPDRSFFIRGYQFPVCMRCTGILIGFVAALLLYHSISLKWWIECLMILPLIIDGSGQYMGYWLSTKFSRMVTGILAGIGSLMIGIKIIINILQMMEVFI